MGRAVVPTCVRARRAVSSYLPAHCQTVATVRPGARDGEVIGVIGVGQDKDFAAPPRARVSLSSVYFCQDITEMNRQKQEASKHLLFACRHMRTREALGLSIQACSSRPCKPEPESFCIAGSSNGHRVAEHHTFGPNHSVAAGGPLFKEGLRHVVAV